MMRPSSLRDSALLVTVLTVVGCSEATPPQMAEITFDPANANTTGPWTPITSCDFTIATAGNYYLANDLLNCPANGVSVLTSDVVLHLNGRTITGTAAARNTDTGDGVSVGRGVVGGVQNVRVRGFGSITGFWGGVFFEQVLSSEVRDVTLTGNKFGIALNAGHRAGQQNNRSRFNQIVSNRLLQNLGHAITINGGDDNVIWFNEATGNEGHGIFLFIAERNDVYRNKTNENLVGIFAEEGGQEPSSLANQIKQNTALNNLAFDLLDLWGDCVHNTWSQNQFGTKHPPCIQ